MLQIPEYWYNLINSVHDLTEPDSLKRTSELTVCPCRRHWLLWSCGQVASSWKQVVDTSKYLIIGIRNLNLHWTLLTAQPASRESGKCFQEFFGSCCPSVIWTEETLWASVEGKWMFYFFATGSKEERWNRTYRTSSLLQVFKIE